MKGVVGCPVRWFHTCAFRQAAVADTVFSMFEPQSPPCLLDMVPEPIMVPASRSRVLAACAISWEIESHIDTCIGRSRVLSFSRTRSSGRCTLLSRHASPVVQRHRYR